MGILIVAIFFGCFTRGAFFGNEIPVLVTLPVIAAAVAAYQSRAGGRLALAFVALSSGGLVVAALVGGHPGGLGTPVAVLVAGGAALYVAASATPEERALLLDGVGGAGAVVAVTGIVGVLSQTEPWAQHAQDLWRAASTLTYANASASLLAVAALVLVARELAGLSGRFRAGLTYLLLLGLLMTISRAGYLAFGAGLVVIAFLSGFAVTARAALRYLPSLAIAGAAVVPQVTGSGSTTSLVLAVAGISAGLVLAVLISAYDAGPQRRRLRVALTVTAAVVASAGILALGLSERGQEVAAKRFSGEMGNRVATWREAYDAFGTSPLVGLGAGEIDLVIDEGGGGGRLMFFVHNEYLQVLTEFGLVGLAGVLVGIGLVVARLAADRRNRAAPVPWMSTGAIAAAAAYLAHAALDFIWHIPVLVVAVAAVIGCGLGTGGRTEVRGSSGNKGGQRR